MELDGIYAVPFLCCCFFHTMAVVLRLFSPAVGCADSSLVRGSREEEVSRETFIFTIGASTNLAPPQAASGRQRLAAARSRRGGVGQQITQPVTRHCARFISLTYKYFKKYMLFNAENPRILCYFHIDGQRLIAILTKSYTITMRCIIANCENICYTNFCKSLIKRRPGSVENGR